MKPLNDTQLHACRRLALDLRGDAARATLPGLAARLLGAADDLDRQIRNTFAPDFLTGFSAAL
jgi:hypothetical protein